MKWTAGKDRFGNISVHEDGFPVFALSDDGKYTISRASTSRGYLSDAWLRKFNSRGGWDLPVQLAGGVPSSVALKACEDHANGSHP